jgi:hypothetical protein
MVILGAALRRKLGISTFEALLGIAYTIQGSMRAVVMRFRLETAIRMIIDPCRIPMYLRINSLPLPLARKSAVSTQSLDCFRKL